MMIVLAYKLKDFSRWTKSANKRIGNVVIILGNHDADLLDNLYFALPEKVHILGTDQVDHLAMQVAGGTIDIFGLSFKPGQQARELKGIFKRGQTNNFAIGMLHCEIGNTRDICQ